MLGMDPITIRSINCLKAQSHLPTGTLLPGKSSLPDLIKTCTEASGCTQTEQGWQLPPLHSEDKKKAGYGFALGLKATGYDYGYPEVSYAKIILRGKREIERAELYCSASDIEQGAREALDQIAARELNLSPYIIDVFLSDTATSENNGATNASRITYFFGNAIKLAARQALTSWNNEDPPASGEGRWSAPPGTSYQPVTGACRDNISYS